MKTKETKNVREKVFNVKVNKKALEKLMARLFWLTLACITVAAVTLFITSIVNMCNAWNDVVEIFYEAWMAIRTPFITSVLCVAWVGMMVVFIKLIKE